MRVVMRDDGAIFAASEMHEGRKDLHHFPSPEAAKAYRDNYMEIPEDQTATTAADLEDDTLPDAKSDQPQDDGLEDKTKAQLESLAQQQWGYEFKGDPTKQEMIDQIRELKYGPPPADADSGKFEAHQV